MTTDILARRIVLQNHLGQQSTYEVPAGTREIYLPDGIRIAMGMGAGIDHGHIYSDGTTIATFARPQECRRCK